MAMGIVSDDEFEKELNRIPSTDKPSIPDVEVIPMPTKGRNIGDNNVPNSLRKIIGETSEIEGRQSALELASHFGLSPASVSAYSNGSTSTDSMKKQPNLPHINNAKVRIAKIATKKLFKSLNAITEDKLQDAKPEVLAQVARNMSAIVKEMEPEQPKDSSEKTAPQFVVFSPQIRDERHYEITVARE
jgi:ABC-type bacteriocin/lantibiotic exporter with double-glycine peptidase domain